MLKQLTQLLTNLKHYLFPQLKPLIPLRPIELINIHDNEYKKVHWV